METSAQIEREFYQDVRNLKRTANGIHARKGKRGYVGTMRLTSDLLRGKEKKKYMGNGEVVTYNMFQSLCSYDDFQQKPINEQKVVMENWRKIYKNTEIIDALGIPKAKFYELMDELDVKKKEAGPNAKKQRDVVPHEGVMPYDQFLALPKEQQKETLIQLREDFTTEVIKKAWGLSTGSFYSLMKRIGIQTKTPKPTRKEIDFQKVLSEPELLPYADLKHLKKEQQAELFDEYKERFNGSLKDLSKAWGVPVNTLYGVSSRLKTVLYEPTERLEEQESYSSLEELLKQTAAVVESPSLEVPSENEEAPTPQVSPETENLKNEIEELKQLVSKLAAQTVPQQPDEMSLGSKVETPTSTQGFTLNFEAEKEGFLLNQEIQHFIRILEKNPETFKVSISITKN